MTNLTPDPRRLRETLAANERRLRQQATAADVSAVGGVVASVCDRFSLECRNAAYRRLSE